MRFQLWLDKEAANWDIPPYLTGAEAINSITIDATKAMDALPAIEGEYSSVADAVQAVMDIVDGASYLLWAYARLANIVDLDSPHPDRDGTSRVIARLAAMASGNIYFAQINDPAYQTEFDAVSYDQLTSAGYPLLTRYLMDP